MTHEPECFYENDEPTAAGAYCQQCVLFRAAYQRGREDEQNEHRIQGEGQVPFVVCGDGA